jgi:hypothetical protein
MPAKQNILEKCARGLWFVLSALVCTVLIYIFYVPFFWYFIINIYAPGSPEYEWPRAGFWIRITALLILVLAMTSWLLFHQPWVVRTLLLILVFGPILPLSISGILLYKSYTRSSDPKPGAEF